MTAIHPYANIERDMIAHEGGVQLEFDFSSPVYKPPEAISIEINGQQVEGFALDKRFIINRAFLQG